MFYYGNKKDTKAMSTYILSVEHDENEEFYKITFANGEVFDNVPITPENTEIIEKRLKKQASVAADSAYKLSHKCKAGKILGILGGPVVGVTTGAVVYHFTGDPALTAGVVSAFSLGGILGSVRYSQRVTPMIEEAEFFNQRLLQHNKIDEFLNNSPNAYRYLAGDTLDDKEKRMDFIQGMKEEGRNPFDFIEIDNDGISNAEFSHLLQGAERERELGFVYKK